MFARADVPARLSIAMLRARQTALGYDFVADPAGTLRTRAGGAALTATNRGVRLSRDGFELGVATTTIGGRAPACA
jgi:hypothetical protein